VLREPIREGPGRGPLADDRISYGRWIRRAPTEMGELCRQAASWAARECVSWNRIRAGRGRCANLTPRRALAETTDKARLYFEIDTVGVSGRGLALIAAKVGKNLSVFEANWRPIC
jgi:hypothetical protein